MTDGAQSGLAKGRLARSSFIVGAGVAGAQGIGLVRELFLATHIGLSGDLDALLVALGVTTLAAGLIASGASGAIVPVYLEAIALHGRENARRLSGAVIAWLGLGGVIFSIVMVLLAPVVISISGPGLSADNHAQATVYLRLLSPFMFSTVVITMMRAICQAEERFGSIALSTVLGPLVTVGIMLALWQPLQLDALVIGTIAGALTTLAVLVIASARVSALPTIRLKTDPRLGPLIRHAAPVTVSGGILEFRGIVDRAIGTLLGPGAVSALRYATVLLQPLTQIGPAWAAVIYPRLVHLTLGTNQSGLAAWAAQWLRTVTAFFVPVAALTIAVAPIAVSFAYSGGAFTSDDLNLTALTLAAYAPMILTLVLLPVLVGSLNARRRGGMLLLGGAVNVVLNIVLDLVFAFAFGAPGIALASSIAEILVVVLFIRFMGRSSDAFDTRPLVSTLAKSLLAIAPLALAIGALSWVGLGTIDRVGAILALIAAGVVGMLGYAALAWWLGIGEVRDVVTFAHARLARVIAVGPRSGS